MKSFWEQDFKFWKDEAWVRAIQWTTIGTVMAIAIIVAINWYLPGVPEFQKFDHKGHSYLLYKDKAITHHPDCTCDGA